LVMVIVKAPSAKALYPCWEKVNIAGVCSQKYSCVNWATLCGCCVGPWISEKTQYILLWLKKDIWEWFHLHWCSWREYQWKIKSLHLPPPLVPVRQAILHCLHVYYVYS
jgi:hypothetical protein